MRNFWLDKKKQDEVVSFANDTSKALFWDNKNNKKKKAPDWWDKRHSPNNDEQRLEGYGVGPTKTEYRYVKDVVFAEDAKALLKYYWLCLLDRPNHTLLVKRLQRYIEQGQWYLIEEQIMGRTDMQVAPDFCDRIKHYISKIQTEKTALRQQSLYEKLTEKVSPAEYATFEDRVEHNATKKACSWHVMGDIDLILKYYCPGNHARPELLTKMTTEDIKVARAVERIQGLDRIQDKEWLPYVEYLIQLGFNADACNDLKDCIANIPPSNWREISRQEVNEQRLAKQKATQEG